ncbi:MAG TPA: ferritin-like protein [Thermoanaerobaculia bacterium]|jgi:hypothetical protein|nr:ferritin-like protein [Thermoanaerobaculia bacterium]
MIRLQWKPLSTVDDAWAMLQTAIGVEFGTLPPYLYAMLSIPPGENVAAAGRIKSVLLQEMIHMCLACNILNALGGDPVLTPPVYPGPLPGDIGPPGGKPLIIHLLPFSKDAMAQGMNIEQPEDPPDFPIVTMLEAAPPSAVTIGQFYTALDQFLATLPASAWIPNRNQIDDSQFFAGQLFPINGYADAHQAISDIVSEGEGTPNSPLDFQNEIAHYYRFGECFHDLVLTKADNPLGYQWGPQKLGIDWSDVYPAIPDPGTHDFSNDPPAAQAAQAACNQAYSQMVDALQQAMTGSAGQLGIAVRAMFDLRMAADVALKTKLADPSLVAGPSFLCPPPTNPGASS